MTARSTKDKSFRKIGAHIAMNLAKNTALWSRSCWSLRGESLWLLNHDIDVKQDPRSWSGAGIIAAWNIGLGGLERPLCPSFHYKCIYKTTRLLLSVLTLLALGAAGSQESTVFEQREPPASPSQSIPPYLRHFTPWFSQADSACLERMASCKAHKEFYAVSDWLAALSVSAP